MSGNPRALSRTLLPWGADVLSWVFAWGLSGGLIHPSLFTLERPTALLCLIGVQSAAGWLLGLYSGRIRFGSPREALGLVAASVLAGAIVWLAAGLLATEREHVLLAFGMALLLMSAVRQLLAAFDARRPASASPVLVLGCGDAGIEFARAALAGGVPGVLPVGFIDDADRKVLLRRGPLTKVGVIGTTADLRDLVLARRVAGVVVAEPLPPAALRECLRALAGSGVWIRKLPEAAELGALVKQAAEANGPEAGEDGDGIIDPARPAPPMGTSLHGPGPGVGGLSVIGVSDLLLGPIPGQYAADVTVRAATAVAGRRILLTGAGGRIGGDIAARLRYFAPAQLVLLDRDEAALRTLGIALSGQILRDPDGVHTVLADVRDTAAMAETFRAARPEIVVHAAGLCDSALLAASPREAWSNNVLGTSVVAAAAREAGVAAFISLSGIGAGEPYNVLSKSQRLGEEVLAAADLPGASVRVGTVLGARNAIDRIFAAQASRGGPLTLTHPGVSRTATTVPDVSLRVLAAIAEALAGTLPAGSVIGPEHAQQVRVTEIARQVLALSDTASTVSYSGLRAGEPMQTAPPLGEDYPRVRVDPRDPAQLPGADAAYEEIVAHLSV